MINNIIMGSGYGSTFSLFNKLFSLSPSVAIISLIIALAVISLMLVSYWKILTKAGRKGWWGIIPIYRTVVLAQVAGFPLWVGLLFAIISCVAPYYGINIITFAIVFIISYFINYNLAKAFGKDFSFAAGLMIFPFVFYPILAFSKNIHYILGQSTQTQVLPSNK